MITRYTIAERIALINRLTL